MLRALLAVSDMLGTASFRLRPLASAVRPHVPLRPAPALITSLSAVPARQLHTSLLGTSLSHVNNSTLFGRHHSSVAVAFSSEDVEASDEYVLEVDYEPMYHNYVALVGTLWSPRHTGSKYSFTLKVERQAKRDEPPPGTGVYDWWQVEADGRIAELAAQKCFEGMLVSVQGSLAVQNQEGGPVASSNVLIRPIEIGLVRTSSPESLVGSADAGVRQVAANPAQYQQYQQQQAAAQAAAAAVQVPGMPDVAGDDAEAKWMRLFSNPQNWFDNRKTKKERQPDFKEKLTGEALWIESRYTPLWAVDNLQLLPGNTPYQGTYFNKQQQRQQQSTYAAAAAPTPPAATAGVQQLPFLPEAASSQQEQNWMEIFTSYNSWWDNRANKRNPKAPDFKNKQDGNRVVWMNDRNTPAWVLAHIDTVLPQPPPPKE